MMLFALQASNCPRSRPETKTPDLISLVKQCKASAVQASLDRGADPNAPNVYGTPPLHWACYYDKKGDIIEKLLKAGARIDTKDKDGYIPLDWAVYKEPNQSAIKQLIQKAIELKNLDLRDSDGRTLLHYAATLGGTEGSELVGKLLELGLKPDVKDNNGRTPLDDDINKHIQVQLLLQHKR
ncbi:MAG: ankyrin repeat domain-containing protein [Candidatus Cardinium sp.]|nr:MAG: ankyrin repeat domain-containing protein [Candidatus Cardinium sp.]